MSGEDETTELPDSLQKFFKITIGMEWPEGSEGGLRAISSGLAAYAEATREIAERLLAAGSDVDDALDGETGDATVDYLKKDMHGWLTEQEAAARDLASKAKDAAADIQKTKIMFIAMTAMALATVASLLASIFGAFMVPAVVAAARVGLMQLLRELVKQIARNIVKEVMTVPNAIKAGGAKGGATAAGKQLWKYGKYPAGGAGFGAALMTTLDAGVQGLQKLDGSRDNINWDSVKGSAIGGAIGGAASGAAAGLSRGIARNLDGALNDINKPIRDFNKRIDDLNAKHGTDFKKVPEKELTGPQRAFGRFLDGMGQVVSVSASNPLVYIATDDHHGVASDGMFGAFARGGVGGGGKVGGGPPSAEAPNATEISGPPELKIPGGKFSDPGGNDDSASLGGETLRGDGESTFGSESSDFGDSETLHPGSEDGESGAGSDESGGGSRDSSGGSKDSTAGSGDSGTGSQDSVTGTEKPGAGTESGDGTGGRSESSGGESSPDRGQDGNSPSEQGSPVSREVHSDGNSLGTVFSNNAPEGFSTLDGGASSGHSGGSTVVDSPPRTQSADPGGNVLFGVQRDESVGNSDTSGGPGSDARELGGHSDSGAPVSDSFGDFLGGSTTQEHATGDSSPSEQVTENGQQPTSHGSSDGQGSGSTQSGIATHDNSAGAGGGNTQTSPETSGSLNPSASTSPGASASPNASSSPNASASPSTPSGSNTTTGGSKTANSGGNLANSGGTGQTSAAPNTSSSGPAATGGRADLASSSQPNTTSEQPSRPQTSGGDRPSTQAGQSPAQSQPGQQGQPTTQSGQPNQQAQNAQQSSQPTQPTKNDPSATRDSGPTSQPKAQPGTSAPQSSSAPEPSRPQPSTPPSRPETSVPTPRFGGAPDAPAPGPASRPAVTSHGAAGTTGTDPASTTPRPATESRSTPTSEARGPATESTSPRRNDTADAPRTTDWSLLWIGLFGLVGLVGSGLYPGTMVGVPGERFSNMAPPTFVIVALLIFQIGTVELLRPGMQVRLLRPRWKRFSELLNEFSLPLYLVHTTGMALFLFLAWITFDIDMKAPSDLDIGWWLTRPLAVIGPFLCTIPVLWLFRRLQAGSRKTVIEPSQEGETAVAS